MEEVSNELLRQFADDFEYDDVGALSASDLQDVMDSMGYKL